MKTMTWYALLLCAVAWPALAAEPTASSGNADADVAGHYYLEGVMETGSELLLVPDGRFAWMMVYGALDLAATGTWRREGDHVVLQGEGIAQAPTFRLFEPTPQFGLVPAADAWMAVVGIPGERPLVGVEVMFESRKGTRATAIADGQGVATLQPHPAGDAWTRTALRRGGHDEPWQWFDMPVAIQEGRVAAFTVADPSAYRSHAFEEMRLRVDGRDLVPSFPWEGGNERGRYIRE